MSLPTQVYTVSQTRQIENKAFHTISEYNLMKRAGQAAFDYIQSKVKKENAIIVFCGKGNNGGDGFVVASLAKQAGYLVTLYEVDDLSRQSAIAHHAKVSAISSGVTPIAYSNEIEIPSDALIVDALLGIGLTGTVRPFYYNIIEHINKAPNKVLSLDVPSGLHADSGLPLGIAIEATYTISFMTLKQGLVKGQAGSYCGELLVQTLDIDPTCFEEDVPAYLRLDVQELHRKLPKRLCDSHKGAHGHVLVVGGDLGMAGAVTMAAEAAERCGAGLVTVATRPENRDAIITRRPEIMVEGIISPLELLPLLENKTVIICGPGIGQSEWARKLVEIVIESSLPKVIDADGLTLLSQDPPMFPLEETVLTPHPGEAGKLLDQSSDMIQSDRDQAILSLVNTYQACCVLKGYASLVTMPNHPLWICTDGNSGMATAGMGDILSGVIGSLMAQGLSAFDAARLGTVLHAVAGDKAASRRGERGIIATDLLPELQELVNY